MSESEFPVSNLEKRIFWGIACAVSGMLLNVGLPLLLAGAGIALAGPPQQKPGDAVAIAILLIVGILFSGSAGFIAGLVRPGAQAFKITLICLLLVDICMILASIWLYFLAAAIKVALLLAVIKRDEKKHPTSGSEIP